MCTDFFWPVLMMDDKSDVSAVSPRPPPRPQVHIYNPIKACKCQFVHCETLSFMSEQSSRSCGHNMATTLTETSAVAEGKNTGEWNQVYTTFIYVLN